MEPRLLERGWEEDPGRLAELAHHLAEDGLVAMPTETVYGFGCLPEVTPLLDLQRLKGRGPERPFLLLLPGINSVPELEWVPEARELAEVFWPGALTLILGDPSSRFPSGVRSLEGGVAVRVSPHPLVRVVVEAVDGPIVSTSANVPGGEPALTAEEALSSARSLGASSSMWVLDGGTLLPSEPSTLIDCTGPAPVIRRVGAIPVQRVKCVLPEIDEQD